MASNKQDELKALELLVTKSKEILDKQTSSYRQKHNNAGIIIGVCALFMPFFISGITTPNLTFRIICVVPVLALVIAMCLLIDVLKARQFESSIRAEELQKMFKNEEEYKNLLEEEFSSNTYYYIRNKKITTRIDRNYNYGIIIVIVTISISAILLVLDKYTCKEKEPLKVELTHIL